MITYALSLSKVRGSGHQPSLSRASVCASESETDQVGP